MSPRRQVYPDLGIGDFRLPALGEANIRGRLGEGVSAVVYDAEWRGRNVALKLYKAGAVERHARLTGGDLAEFEFHRNRAFYRTEGLSRYVAEPLAFRSTAGLSLFVQERLDGPLYYEHCMASGGRVDPALFEHVKSIVDLSHAAGLYDVDLHAGNMVLVEDGGAGLVPKLFDFNFIPFYVHAPNPIVWLAFRLRLVDRGWRDRRKLARFHDFSSVEKKLAKFGGRDTPAVSGPGGP